MDDNQLKTLHQEVSSRLSSVDFDRIWPDFAFFPFALYTSDRMYFEDLSSPRPETFMGNTSIDYEGRRIAIWNVDYSPLSGAEDLDRLAAGIVHEMFHAFQHARGEERFPNDLRLLLYPDDPLLAAWTLREGRLLARESPDLSALLGQISGFRNERSRIGGAALGDELLAETAEGLAEFAGWKALAQFRPPEAQKSLARYRRILGQGLHLFDARRRSYYAGTLLALLAEEAGLPLFHDLSSSKPLWELLNIPPSPPDPLAADEEESARLLQAKEGERRADLLASFRSRFPDERIADTRIIGYDPMNLTRVGDWLISSHFLLLEDDPEQALLGDRLLRMKKGDPRQVEAVYYSSD